MPQWVKNSATFLKDPVKLLVGSSHMSPRIQCPLLDSVVHTHASKTPIYT